MEQPAAQPDHVRASDADRDRVSDVLREALAEGRITPEEHAERLDAVYAAKTLGELVPITSDLPARAASAANPAPGVEVDAVSMPVRGGEHVVAIFGGATRTGRWLVEPHTNVTAIFGGADFDFREAVLARREVTINVTCMFGGVDMIVPDGVRVHNSTTAIFGGTDLAGTDQIIDAEAPVIRLTGVVFFGGIDVKRKRPRGHGKWWHG
ncbi:MAG: DUF1707 domain-containing protein [Streptosporangiales bacterium]|nr:DUF1707 domain-containing protein [Streptosporangiales bacterium]